YLRFNSITFPRYGDGCKLTENRLYIQGVGLLKVKLHRPVGGPIKTVTLKRVGQRWYVAVVCEVAVVPWPATGQTVGIDLGLESFLMTDTGPPCPTRVRRGGPKPGCAARNGAWRARSAAATGGAHSGGVWHACTSMSPTSVATSTTRRRMRLCRRST